MKITRKKRNRIDIAESGALSDLAFLLIIFFIVIAVFNVNKGFLLKLPKKDSHKIVNTEDIFKISLRQNGTLFVKNQNITLSEVESNIVALKAERPNMTFLLQIDPEARYQHVVEIVELVRNIGVDNFSFNMKKSKLDES